MELLSQLWSYEIKLIYIPEVVTLTNFPPIFPEWYIHTFCPIVPPSIYIVFFFYFSELKEKFNIIAIPKLIILSQTGKIITVSGRKEVQDRGFVCFNHWQKVADENWRSCTL